MAKLTRIHQNKRPVRRHFIAEWAEVRNLRQTDIVEQLAAAGWDVDKGLVSRWFAGTLPQPRYQVALAALFEIEPEQLMQNPETDWLTRFFAGRSREEVERIKQAMELAWPKTGTSGHRDH